MFSELENVGKLALVECVRTGDYDAEKADLQLMLLHFWTEQCGGIWNVVWGHYLLTGPV